MKLWQVVRAVGDAFQYAPDHSRRGEWRILPEGDEVGDCEDYVLTVYWRWLGPLGFIWKVLIAHQARIYKVKSASGPHAVGAAHGLWFDNWTRRTLSRQLFFDETGHEVERIYTGPEILFRLATGKFGFWPVAAAVVASPLLILLV